MDTAVSSCVKKLHTVLPHIPHEELVRCAIQYEGDVQQCVLVLLTQASHTDAPPTTLADADHGDGDGEAPSLLPHPSPARSLTTDSELLYSYEPIAVSDDLPCFLGNGGESAGEELETEQSEGRSESSSLPLEKELQSMFPSASRALIEAAVHTFPEDSSAAVQYLLDHAGSEEDGGSPSMTSRDEQHAESPAQPLVSSSMIASIPSGNSTYEQEQSVLRDMEEAFALLSPDERDDMPKELSPRRLSVEERTNYSASSTDSFVMVGGGNGDAHEHMLARSIDAIDELPDDASAVPQDNEHDGVRSARPHSPPPTYFGTHAYVPTVPSSPKFRFSLPAAVAGHAPPPSLQSFGGPAACSYPSPPPSRLMVGCNGSANGHPTPPRHSLPPSHAFRPRESTSESSCTTDEQLDDTPAELGSTAAAEPLPLDLIVKQILRVLPDTPLHHAQWAAARFPTDAEKAIQAVLDGEIPPPPPVPSAEAQAPAIYEPACEEVETTSASDDGQALSGSVFEPASAVPPRPPHPKPELPDAVLGYSPFVDDDEDDADGDEGDNDEGDSRNVDRDGVRDEIGEHDVLDPAYSLVMDVDKEDESQALIRQLLAEEEELRQQREREAAEHEKALHALLEDEQRERQRELDAKQYQCVICDEEYPLDDMYTVDDCFHKFCFECMEGYLISKITDGETRNIACPGYHCEHILTCNEVKHCVSKEMYEKYDRFLLASALNSDPSCRWCPRPGCGCAMLGQSDQPMLTCPNEKCMAHACSAINNTCDVIMNFVPHMYRQNSDSNDACRPIFLLFQLSGGGSSCSRIVQWHADATCAQYQEWKVENSEAADRFELWKGQNTKACPQCEAPIEKNGGCNHMTCVSCKYQFCWLCMEKCTQCTALPR